MERAIRRTAKQNKIDAWRVKQARHSLKSEAVIKARAYNERLGIVQPHRRNGVEDMLNRAKNLDKSPTHRKHITLPGEKPVEVQEDARTIAEREAIDALYASIELLQWHLDVLSHTPNPTYGYQNRISQQRLANLVLLMLECINKIGHR
jgi:hypothetical protein